MNLHRERENPLVSAKPQQATQTKDIHYLVSFVICATVRRYVSEVGGYVPKDFGYARVCHRIYVGLQKYRGRSSTARPDVGQHHAGLSKFPNSHLSGFAGRVTPFLAF